MSEEPIEKDESSFAGSMSATLASGFTTLIMNGSEVNFSFVIGSFDIVPILISFIVFSVSFYPFHRFFDWLYSASANKK